MNPSRFLPLLVAGLLALLAGCATYPHSGPKALAGTWHNSLGTVWMIHDGTFDVDLNHDGKRDAWGTCTVSGDTVSIVSTGGFRPKGCKGAGVYHFSRTADGLHFTLVKDDCKLRVKNVLLAWHEK